MEHGVAPDRLTATMVLRVLEEQDSIRTVGIVVQNPEKVPVRSIRSWVRFDPSAAQVTDLSISDDRFILFAPGEKAVDASEGFVKLGGAAREPVTDEEILFATFTLRVSGRTRSESGGTMPVLTFHDWRAEGDGHAAVLSVEDGKAVNVLGAPSPLQL